MKNFTAVLSLSLLVLSSTGQAASVNEREARQRQSIHNGLEDGSLTRNEARHLRGQQVRLEAKERVFKYDGSFTPRERVSMQRSLNTRRAAIYRQRHDAQVQD